MDAAAVLSVRVHDRDARTSQVANLKPEGGRPRTCGLYSLCRGTAYARPRLGGPRGGGGSHRRTVPPRLTRDGDVLAILGVAPFIATVPPGALGSCCWPRRA